MDTSEAKQNLVLYSDNGIQTEIWNAVRQYAGIRALDTGSFSISVKDDFVFLTGHVSNKYHHDLIEEVACSTPGVNTVHNKLVVDSDLTIQVAESLARDERTRHFILPVGCSHGWIRLGGVVPRRELQTAAEEIAAQVPAVRGVLSRPTVLNESPEREQQPIQPQIQAKVYDHNLQEGVITQVVIRPRNRLVTHVVVSTSDFCDGKFVFYECLVPVEGMEVVNKESILLKRNGPSLHAFPAFEASDYPLTPSNWQPPYPYMAGEVRWICEERERVDNDK